MHIHKHTFHSEKFGKHAPFSSFGVFCTISSVAVAIRCNSTLFTRLTWSCTSWKRDYDLDILF